MYKKTIFTLLATLGVANSAFAANDTQINAGIVNIQTCVSESKYGLKEKENFEQVQSRFSQLISEQEKQLKEIADKLQDADYMDGLSKEAESELKAKFSSLNEELMRYQNLFYQTIQQANAKLWQAMNEHIQTASQEVAKKKNLNMIINKETSFFYNPKLDVTEDIIKVMDKQYEVTEKSAKKESPEKK